MEVSNVLIKPDPEPIETLCWTCLSSDRKVFELGTYKELFLHLIHWNNVDILQDSIWLDEMRICWECSALLRRVSEFQIRAVKANEMLDTARRYDLSLNFDSLSFLKKSEMKTIEIESKKCSKKNIKKRLKTETLEENISIECDWKNEDFSDSENLQNNDNFDDKNELFSLENLQFLDVKTETESEQLKIEDENFISTEKVSKSRRNKTKYKIIKLNTLKTNSKSNKGLFERKYLKHSEMLAYREELRNKTEFKENSFKCTKCILSFKCEPWLLRHCKLFHNSTGRYICNICEQTFTKKDPDLLLHMRMHYLYMKCKLCGYTNNLNIKSFYKHVSKHRNEIGLQCTKCKRIFTSYTDLYKHYKLHTKFECDLCGKVFRKNKTLLEMHLTTKHGFDGPQKCKQCNKSFLNTRRLKTHIFYSHRKVPTERRYCVECDKTYATVYTYNHHFSLTHGPKSKIPKQKYQCPHCSKSFTNRFAHRNHIKLVHEKKTDYHCAQHGKYFANKGSLKAHLQMVHERVMPPKNKICPHCGHGFRGITALENHIRTHTGERPHKCPHCNSAFAQRTPLVSHVKRIHMMEPPPPPKRSSSNAEH